VFPYHSHNFPVQSPPDRSRFHTTRLTETRVLHEVLQGPAAKREKDRHINSSRSRQWPRNVCLCSSPRYGSGGCIWKKMGCTRTRKGLIPDTDRPCASATFRSPWSWVERPPVCEVRYEAKRVDGGRSAQRKRTEAANE
jgi:hypothetical protein